MFRRFSFLLLLLPAFSGLLAQETFPVNGIEDNRPGTYAFINATIVKDARTSLQKATLVASEGRIVSIGTDIAIPKEAIVIDCEGKYIYPSFIDVYSNYGIPTPQRAAGEFNFFAPAQLNSNKKGAFGWNEALKTDVEAHRLFAKDEKKAKELRGMGFGVVLTHQQDGIARGTGAVVTLVGERENLAVLKERASAHYSFNKGTSTQSYPGSLMGAIALLRQTFLDAAWFKSAPQKEGVNISLRQLLDAQQLPQFFEANDKWNALRADRIGDEFGFQYIIKAGGNEYQRINDIKATQATFILPLNFPQPQDVEDANDARFISLNDLKHWELAPANPAAFQQAGIPFCITAADLPDTKQFLSQLQKAIRHGLSDTEALVALTERPAQLLGLAQSIGTLEAGKLANFLITSAPIFSTKAVILQNWVQGRKYGVKEDAWSPADGMYKLTINAPSGSQTHRLQLKNNKATLISRDSTNIKLSYDGKLISMSFPLSRRSPSTIRLSGTNTGNGWEGNGLDTAGNRLLWSAVLESKVEATDTTKQKPRPDLGEVIYPAIAYGFTADNKPATATYLFRNATVWTSEKEGKLENTDVLVRHSKIEKIGKGIGNSNAIVIDATGKHLTAGIIDEHSHIAAASINEGGQSVTSEVRIGDNLNPDDINIYRQLAGGVTTSHILHGSANTIGGQTQLIKLRWGANDKELKFEGADPFIKFALGENVKRTPAQQNNRYPDTRMGVEQVLDDAFRRAKLYQQEWKQYEASSKKNRNVAAPRRDLELDALVEILEGKRFITCHSYVQSEINAIMKIAEKYGFTVNTFTHILEGYKVADKMKKHGASASTFSDWWIYKNEVIDAIPANASIMNTVGLNVAINSDDAEMARRLNQEAAKSIKYGNMNETEALNMVTINPARMLHIDKKVGSIKAGKDADLVLWSHHPLSIYARAEKTMVDGILYFDRQKDEAARKQVAAERNRLINKMLGEKRAGTPTQTARASMEVMHFCDEDHGHSEGLLIIDGNETH